LSILVRRGAANLKEFSLDRADLPKAWRAAEAAIPIPRNSALTVDNLAASVRTMKAQAMIKRDILVEKESFRKQQGGNGQ
jgi:hypothetical protein